MAAGGRGAIRSGRTAPGLRAPKGCCSGVGGNGHPAQRGGGGDGGAAGRWVRQLIEAFQRLDPDRRRKAKGEASATDAADAAAKTQRRLGRVCRKAASALLDVEDLREVMGKRELYRRLSRISQTLIEAADRVWYAKVKEG